MTIRNSPFTSLSHRGTRPFGILGVIGSPTTFIRKLGYVAHTLHGNVGKVGIEDVVTISSLEEHAQSQVFPTEITRKTIREIGGSITDNSTILGRKCTVTVYIEIFDFTHHTLSLYVRDVGIERISAHLGKIIIKAVFYITQYRTDG